MNQGWTYRDRISNRHAHCTLVDYYTQHYPHSTADQWRQRIVAQQILVDGQPALPQTQLQPGQQLTYQRPPWQEPSAPLDLPILHEDADLLVVNKPSGLPVLPGANFLEHTLLWQVRQRQPSAYPIHRLGRGTSGVMLLAKTQAARCHLSQQMRQHHIDKRYWAIVSNGMGDAQIPDTFTTDQPIGKCPHPLLGYVYGAAATGLTAHSAGQVLQRWEDKALIEVAIATGRPHQIRIHLAALGHPLLGDPLYPKGGKPNPDAVPGDCGYWLHAYQLRFTHPTTGTPVEIRQRPSWSGELGPEATTPTAALAPPELASAAAVSKTRPTALRSAAAQFP
ncbi:MAG: RluA family pseudouridine synthase [Cyanobacteria bacterium P01_A01_bin.105]